MAKYRAAGGRRPKRSTLAGTWYPGDPGRLAADLDRFLGESTPATIGAAGGVIVPHAGYQYSGPVAAAAYRLLETSPCERVVLLAPSHHRRFRGIAVLDAEAFETPLGLIGIDPIARTLAGSGLIHLDTAAYEDEHSLEIHLPFLQRVRPEARVIPLLFGELEASDDAAVAGTLADLAGDRTVFVVSSDFTHYGWRFGYEPFPPDNAEYVSARLRELDMGAIEPILRGDAQGFRRYVADTGDTVCGRIPIAAFLAWVGGRYGGQLLAYRTSLDITGDYEHSVSYAAIAFPREEYV